MHLLRRTALGGAALLALGTAMPAAQASGTWYTNEAAFLAAVSGTLTDSYSDLGGFYAGPLSRLSGSLGISAVGGIFVGNSGGTATLGTNNPNMAIELSGTAYDSIGGIFSLTDASFSKLTGTATFEIFDGATLISSNPLPLVTANSFFIGYVGSSAVANPILKFTPASGTSAIFAGAEKVYLGNAVPTSGTTGGGGAVPEPGEWAAMGILAGGLAGLVIKRRKQA